MNQRLDCLNNVTSKMHVPGVTTQDQILGLVTIGQRNVYPGGAEYGELGLSVVIRTGRDESGTELVAIRYFAVEMANRTTLTLSMRAASETKMNVMEESTGTVQVMESVAICSSDEFTFRLVMTPDANQHSIDWNVFDYGTYQGYVFDRNIIRSSPSYSNPSLSRTALLAEFGLPKPLSSCLIPSFRLVRRGHERFCCVLD